MRAKWLGVLAVFMITASVQAAMWTNGPSGDMKFSTQSNWTNNVLPVAGEALNGLKGSSSSNHALVDSGFSIGGTNGPFGNFNFNGGAAGTAYLDIQSGATLKSANVTLGNVNQAGWNGDLTLKTGGTLVAGSPNSGNLQVGSMTSTSKGIITVDNGATFGFANLNLTTNGTIKFILGADSVSTFNSTRSTTGGTNLLNGLIQVDLGALTTDGTYTLINGVTNILDGLLVTGLLSGGSYSNNGNYSSANFAVLNGETKKWTLALADGNKDLTLTVIPEPTTISLFVVAGIGAMMLRRMTR